jgi:hypothetical protein
VLTEADTELRLAQDPRVTVELALLKLVQLRRLLPFAELVERVERMAGGAAPPAPRPAAAAPAPPGAPAPARSPAPPPRATAPAPPPPVEPAPAAAPSAAPDDLLGALAAQARPSLAQPLRGAQVREEGDFVVLEVQPDFFRLAETHLDEYLDLVRRVSGRPRKVRIVASEAEGGARSPDTTVEEEQRRRKRDEAVGEPAVQEALDLFGGRVVEVREPKPS